MELLSQPVPSPPVTSACSNESRMDIPGDDSAGAGGAGSTGEGLKDVTQRACETAQWVKALFAKRDSLSKFCLYGSSPILRRHNERRDLRPASCHPTPTHAPQPFPSHTK